MTQLRQRRGINIEQDLNVRKGSTCPACVRLKWRGQRKHLTVEYLRHAVADNAVEQMHPDILTRQTNPVATRMSPHAHILLLEEKLQEAQEVASGVASEVPVDPVCTDDAAQLPAAAAPSAPVAKQAQQAQRAVETNCTQQRSQELSPQLHTNTCNASQSAQHGCDAAVLESSGDAGRTAQAAECKEQSLPPRSRAHGSPNRAHTATAHANIMPQTDGPTTSGEGSPETPPPGVRESHSQGGSGGHLAGAVAQSAHAPTAEHAARMTQPSVPEQSATHAYNARRGGGGNSEWAQACAAGALEVHIVAEPSWCTAQHLDAAWQSLVVANEGTTPGIGSHGELDMHSAKVEQKRHDTMRLPPNATGAACQDLSAGGAHAAHAQWQGVSGAAAPARTLSAVATNAIPARPTAACTRLEGNAVKVEAAVNGPASVRKAHSHQQQSIAAAVADCLQASSPAAQIRAASTTQHAPRQPEQHTEAIETAARAAAADVAAGVPLNLNGGVIDRQQAAGCRGREGQGVEEREAAKQPDEEPEHVRACPQKCTFCGYVTSGFILCP